MEKRIKEQWADIPGYPDYVISSYGKLWSLEREKIDGRRMQGKWLVGNCNQQVGIRITGGQSWTVGIGKLVLMTFDRFPRQGEMALHKDDDRTNNKLDNLYWGDSKDNHQDAIRNGTMGKGTKTAFRQSEAKRNAWKEGRYDQAAIRASITKATLKEFLG